jgi:hypothetical protein
MLMLEKRTHKATAYELYYGRRKFKRARTYREAVKISVQTIATLSKSRLRRLFARSYSDLDTQRPFREVVEIEIEIESTSNTETSTAQSARGRRGAALLFRPAFDTLYPNTT